MKIFFLPDVQGIIVQQGKQLIRLNKNGYHYSILNPEHLEEMESFSFDMDLEVLDYNIIYDYVRREYPELLL